MHKLISELTRLYLPPGAMAPETLTQHLLGLATVAVNLATDEGQTRALLIPFAKTNDREEAQHWTRLCAVANALQSELGLPAPAVSISGGDAYGLWLSLAAPTPVARVRQFLALLHKAYFPDMPLPPDAAGAPVELPPCLHQATGKWAAFIHPGMGASFADEPGLEMPPPVAGQVAFLEGLQSISEAEFQRALNLLQQAHGSPSMADAPVPQRAATTPDGLLLKDATLEDIVTFLHSKNIEPTFRHLLPPN
ncbi:hypothetical protein [Pseudoduganella namucuonensis]|uniref:Uncharacterized protein n=1 Tax=Pseudoduganella namucuonensis TaxID=1035707 RepID=A0A1I7JMT1_9BURK|nr:hypothetical protein [Pseudoduganella namucuonensis]SFU86469.1 hypothetical protein SAMN05216552_101266 [Pseudoduganella namucuonensis]